MQFKTRSLLTLAVVLALGALAWRVGQWKGLVLLVSALVLWVLMFFTRMMTVLRRAAGQPVGHVGSAVMLNSRLRAGASLLHVITMTQSLGERVSEIDAQPEVFRWRDAGGSRVDAEFEDGRLRRWRLERPAQDAPQDA